LSELGSASLDDAWLLPRIFETLRVGPVFITNQFEKKRNVIRRAFGAHSIDPCLLLVSNRCRFKRVVVELDFYTIGSDFLESADRPETEQIGLRPGSEVS